MGTRADFYVGRGADAEWIGSIAFDGYPGGIKGDILKAATEAEYRARVASVLAADESGTTPDHGWPWPWNDSHTTDYAYAIDGGKVWGSYFGNAWWPADEPEPEDPPPPKPVFPDMSGKQAVTFGKRSGVLVLSPK